MVSSMTVVCEVVGRSPAKSRLWLRVPYKNGYRILLLDDDLLPHGMKSATLVEADVKNIRPRTGVAGWAGYTPIPDSGYTAEVEILNDVSDSGEGGDSRG